MTIRLALTLVVRKKNGKDYRRLILRIVRRPAWVEMCCLKSGAGQTWRKSRQEKYAKIQN